MNFRWEKVKMCFITAKLESGWYRIIFFRFDTALKYLMIQRREWILL